MIQLTTANLAIYLAGYVLSMAGTAMLFRKAGLPGWKGFIPFYNTWNLFRLTWSTKYFWILSGLTAVTAGLTILQNLLGGTAVLIAYAAIALNLWYASVYIRSRLHLAAAYGRGIVVSLGLILFGPVFLLILGFGRAGYQGRVEKLIQVA